MRHISELKQLPISELSDEEIVKAAMHRLHTKALMLVYDDRESNKWIFLYRYKKDGAQLLKRLRDAWEGKFGKFKKIGGNDEKL